MYFVAVDLCKWKIRFSGYLAKSNITAETNFQLKEIRVYFCTSDESRRIFPDLRFYVISRIFIRICVATNGLEIAIFRRLTRQIERYHAVLQTCGAVTLREKRKGAAAG